MPLNTKISGLARYIKDTEAICLMEDQARHIYEKLESENIVNIYTIKQGERGRNIDDKEGEINLYHEIITNKVEKDMIISHMEQWLILSNVVNYVQYKRCPKNFYDLDIKAVDQKRHEKICGKEVERQILELDFGDTPEN